MSENQQPEVWLRGPLPEFPVLLQPIAFALLQAQEDVNKIMLGFPDDLLYERPGGTASPAFHLQHLSGVLDRMFTYAENLPLKEAQLNWLQSEGKIQEKPFWVEELVANFNQQIETSLQKLQKINAETLTEPRGVGRKQLPSTVFGLLFHAAEHTQRHVGQLLVTVKVLTTQKKDR
ncbi:DinB family protein [uncultured Mucilaginibacter sp.]|uniref:DinB family protein n=1 Tax=uncultured Mucilaginibacter sp. TaxID=797541 RepID=UPI002608FCCC|nr:DinB family protein [uncultured Mucilaginibacter sp.]